MAFRTTLARIALAILGALAMTERGVSAQPEQVTSVEGITEYRLENGFRFLLFPDDSKPLVTTNMTVFVGSRHEGYGETGMAHLLEHMLFKGTPTFPAVPKALRDHGARFNGTTWVDRTNYFETMPATDDNLEFGIHLESDRLLNSFVKREDLVSEMTVVRNEFEMGENNPERVLSQRMMAVAFEWHNYGKSTIGNRSDIERVPIENLQAFYRKYYRVDNCMLIVAGKFDAKKAIEYIDKYFAPLKRPETPLTSTYTEEPPQDGERTVVLRRVGSVGATGVVYHVPAGASPDFAPLQVLEDVLTSEPSGRVYKALVETKKASSVDGSVQPWHDPGVLEITAKVEGDQENAARDALIDTLENLHQHPVTAAEVERAKTRYKKSIENLVASSDRFAVQLSEWAAAGDWRLFFIDRDRVEAVTADDVNRVAAKYLTRNNRTVGIFYPSKTSERAAIPATPDVGELVKAYKGKAALAQGEAFDTAAENIEKRATIGKLETLQYAVLPKKTRGEMANLRLSLYFGSEKSLNGYNTAARLLGPMMRRGTKNHNRQELNDALDKLGAQLMVSSELGHLSVSLQTKKAELLPALKLVGEILREPAFPEGELDLLRREQLEMIGRMKTDPQALASTALRRKLTPYPKDDVRYVPTLEESYKRYEAVKLDEIKKVYAQLGANHGDLAVVGDFEPEPVLNAVRDIIKDWRASVPYQRIDRTYTFDVPGGKERIDTPDKENAVYLAGHMFAMNDADPQYAVIKVGNYLFGGAPLSSRLSNRVRGEEGLSYGIGSMFSADALDKSASEMIYAITNPKNVDKVNAAVHEEIAKFVKAGVSLSELEEGKSAYLQAQKVARSNDGTLASQLVDCLHEGRTYRFYVELEKKILEVQPSEIQAAFKKVIDPSKLVIIEAGDFNKK